ncbi:hypothetical protein ON010_g3066 [Phytophthora cinnamomi]|nr:hypothetical protein ON010_g3066 [Phytophthora cinnamomi]
MLHPTFSGGDGAALAVADAEGGIPVAVNTREKSRVDLSNAECAFCSIASSSVMAPSAFTAHASRFSSRGLWSTGWPGETAERSEVDTLRPHRCETDQKDRHLVEADWPFLG